MTSENQTRVYSAVCKDVNRQGFGGINHHLPIEKADLVKMYQNFDFANPKHSQWKVFCGIMLYVCRRGRENLREMKRSDCACTTDSDGLRYIYICKDELTKNHKMTRIQHQTRCMQLKVLSFLRKKLFSLS